MSDDYIYESDVSVLRRNRRRRTAATLIVVMLLLFFAFWYALSYIRAGSEPEAATVTPTCTPGEPVTRDQVDVGVYNSTNRSGLAASVAEELRQRGYSIVEVANDPLSKTIEAAIEVRLASEGGQPYADVVGVSLGEVTSAPDNRTDPTRVDVVLGDGFESLPAEPDEIPTITLDSCP